MLVIPTHRTRITTLLLLLSTLGSAQIATEEINAVNALFNKSVVVRVDRQDRFVFDLFDATGRFRQDVVPVEQLDADNIHYSAEEDAVIIGCKAENAQCISKEIFKLNTIRLTGRSNFPRPSTDDGGVATMAALRALILAAQQQLPTAGETKERSPRRK
jgi:hypothetical protein